MRVAQSLYEGVDIQGEGLNALITYMRTDSVRVSPEFQSATLSYINKVFGKEYAPAKPNLYKSGAGAQDAHEAIRPISIERTPASLEGRIDRDAWRLYKLIYDRYLASQMTNALFNTMVVHITATGSSDKLGFTVRGRSPKFDGFTAVYAAASTKKEGEEDDELSALPDLSEGDKLKLKEPVLEQKFTKPPSRYSEATLVKAMEENGVGRPSTYASMISVIAKREYTEKQGKAIAPTKLGETVCEYMENNFPDIMNLTFTARMEGALDNIADGDKAWTELVGAFWPRLKRFVEHAGKSDPSVSRMPDEESDVICDKCGAKMVIKDGRYGKFLACPSYPKCKNTKPIISKVATCPKCGGDVISKRSKAGKTFYGCANYPKCDFISWDIPGPYLCPDCGSTMKMMKKSYVCTNKTCGRKDEIKSE
jgi:DNA topoisomerase-1